MTSVPAPAEPGLLAANLICMASMVIWAAGLPAASHLIPLLPYEDLNLLRMGISAVALVLAWALIEGPGAMVRAPWARGMAVGSLIGIGAWLLIQGQARGGAVLAAVISSSLPVVGIAIEMALDGRRLTPAIAGGLALALVGGGMMLTGSDLGPSLLLGALAAFGSVLTYAMGSRWTVTALPRQTPLGRTAVTVTGAAAAALVLSVIAHAGGQPLPDVSGWGWLEWADLALFSLGALALSQLLWIVAVGRLGIGMSALHINASPFYVMLILFALGAPWSWREALAAAVVGLGVLVAQGLIPLRLIAVGGRR